MPKLVTLFQSDQWQALKNDLYFRLYGRKGQAAYIPEKPVMTNTILTIGDFVEPNTLQRFRLKPF
jgi:hypothetical protein